MTRRPEPQLTTRPYLGPHATSGDAEMQGILLALQITSNLDQVLLLSDSQASIATLHKLAQGSQPTRSDIESQIKHELAKRAAAQMDTGVSWVRSYIGIKGNEVADREAGLCSYSGQLLSKPYTATEAGIRQHTKQARASARIVPSTGIGNQMTWPRQALSAYTWARTNRGPFKYWLHKIGKADSPNCPACDHHAQDGFHVTFQCPALAHHRNRLMGAREGDTWAHLDRPILIKYTQDPNRQQDGVQDFFHVIFTLFH